MLRHHCRREVVLGGEEQNQGQPAPTRAIQEMTAPLGMAPARFPVINLTRRPAGLPALETAG